MKRNVIGIAGFLVAVSIAITYAQPAPSYIGIKKCKTCHKSKKVGNQYEIWEKTLHAKAYTDLANNRAKQVAKDAGVKGDPQKSDKCLKCHITAFGVPAAQKENSLTLEEGVSCEACHGPGSQYMRLHIKKKAAANAAGFIHKPDKSICEKCHNKESPTFKGFEFNAMLKKMAHPKPKPEKP